METSTTSVLPSLHSHKPTFDAIVAMILNEAPAGLSAYDRKQLEYRLSQEETSTYLSMCFERSEESFRASVDLNLNWDGMWNSNRIVDAQGNIWKELQFTVTLNAPAYGSGSPAQYMKRAELLSDVSTFAQKLIDTFNEPQFMMMATAAEAATQKEREVARTLSQTCERLVLNNRTKMRVSQEREISIEDSTTLKVIPMHHSSVVEANDGKTYKIVRICAGVRITRLR